MQGCYSREYLLQGHTDVQRVSHINGWNSKVGLKFDLLIILIFEKLYSFKFSTLKINLDHLILLG